MTKKKMNKDALLQKSGIVEDVKVSTKSIRPIVIKNRGQYRIVESDSSNIMPSTIDNRSEDEVLNYSRRQRLLDIVRNLVRNSSLFSTILGQLTTNVVSTQGGKVVLSLPSDQTNKDIRKQFYRWTRNADFHTCDTFNTLLKRVLREYVIGGQVILVFDDGLVENSGKLLMFESNEIVDVAPEEVEKRYGKGCWSSQGQVYSPNGRSIGVIVSRSQSALKNGEFADPSKCYFLKKDPNACPLENYWYNFTNAFRKGRGVTPASSAISTVHQLEDLISSELLSSRLSSQLFCWLVKKNQDQDVVVPSPFDSGQDYDNLTNDQIESMVKEAQKEDAEQVFQLRRAKESSVAFEQLPEGYEAQQVQTLHPNTNVQTIVDFLSARCAATLGLSKAFVTGAPEDGNWRSNQLFSYPAICEFQKSLEQICDWVFYRFVKWAQKKGLIKAYVAEDFMDYCDWQWKGIDSLDPVANENAIEKQLKNMTKNYKDILGPDWKEKLEQSAYEANWMKEHGIVPTRDLMLSGGQTEQSKQTSDENGIDEESEDENKNEEVIEA